MKNVPKIYVSADELLLDSFRLARQVLDSGWRPELLVALWRGGAPVGVAIHEFMVYHRVPLEHMALKCASYSGIESHGTVRLDDTDHLRKAVRRGLRVLVADDIFDSGATASAVLDLLAQLGAEARLATVFWRPAKNITSLRPHYHVRTTDQWIVFPHELLALTPAEIASKSPAIAALFNGFITPAHGATAAATVRP